MKKTYKALLCGAAAVAAVGIAYAMDERFFEKAKDKLTVFKCRANSKIMEQALPLTDAMFPGPKVVSGQRKEDPGGTQRAEREQGHDRDRPNRRQNHCPAHRGKS